jgi:ribosome-associated protein
MQEDLVVKDNIIIKRNELKLTFSLSSGPGGQNVNKVNTKVRLEFNLKDSNSISDDIKERITNKYPNKITKDGILFLESSEYRTQNGNLESAKAKLKNIIKNCLIPTKKRIKTKTTKTSILKRLKNKKKRSFIKKNRKVAWED